MYKSERQLEFIRLKSNYNIITVLSINVQTYKFAIHYLVHLIKVPYNF